MRSGAWLPPEVWLEGKPLTYSVSVSLPIKWGILYEPHWSHRVVAMIKEDKTEAYNTTYDLW